MAAWLLVLTLLLALPVLVFWLQIVLARPLRADAEAASAPTGGRLAVLIPAHDEGVGLAATLSSVKPQLCAGDRLLVVADNCGDDTAAVARREGAEAVERHDAERRGKGYALDFGVRHLAATGAPELLVMLDADCLLHPGALDRLAAACRATGRPCQALYLMQAPSGAGLRQRFAEFAWRVRNRARPLGWRRIGAPCQLMGSGMAFAWDSIRCAPLASGHIVEDMQLGIDLALAGSPPLFVPEALVTSRFPDTDTAAASQRRRWEHGHLALLLGAGPRLLWAGLSRLRPALIGMAADLMVPPLALLLMLSLGLAAFNLALGALSGLWLPAAASLAAIALLGWAVLLAWWRHGRDLLGLGEMAGAPLYALRKMPLYAGFLRRRQAEWVRAKRDGE